MRSCEFESLQHILKESFFTFVCCCKSVLMFEKAENKQKRGRILKTKLVKPLTSVQCV